MLFSVFFTTFALKSNYMNIYPLNSTQEDMLRESNMETMENGFQVTVFFEVPADRLSADEMATAR